MHTLYYQDKLIGYFVLSIQYLMPILVTHVNLTKINKILNPCAKTLNDLHFETKGVEVITPSVPKYSSHFHFGCPKI